MADESHFKNTITAQRHAKWWSLLSSGVRLSVHLSVTFVYCIQTVEDIVNYRKKEHRCYSKKNYE